MENRFRRKKSKNAYMALMEIKHDLMLESARADDSQSGAWAHYLEIIEDLIEEYDHQA